MDFKSEISQVRPCTSVPLPSRPPSSWSLAVDYIFGTPKDNDTSGVRFDKATSDSIPYATISPSDNDCSACLLKGGERRVNCLIGLFVVLVQSRKTHDE